MSLEPAIDLKTFLRELNKKLWTAADQHRETEAQLRDPQSDYYIEKNVFWVPALAKWQTLQDSAKLPPSTEIEITNSKKTRYKITSNDSLIVTIPFEHADLYAKAILGQLFINTPVPTYIWFLVKSPTSSNERSHSWKSLVMRFRKASNFLNGVTFDWIEDCKLAA